MTFPEGIKISENPTVTGEYGAGFFFMAENGTAIYGRNSYLLFQEVNKLKIFKGEGATLMELASFDAPADSTPPANAEPPQNSEPINPLTFHYAIHYTSLTGEIQLFRDSTLIGSYTDPSPIQSSQVITLMTHFTKTSFDNISVKAGTKTETKAFNTHVDHLGSSSIITAGLTLDGQLSSKTGQIVQSLDQYPYGEKRIDEKSSIVNSANPDPSTTNTSSFSTKKTFTGKELDAETGLYYSGARYYDSRIGRFISGDSAQKYITDVRSFVRPQGWNAYSYALNNPLRYTDPSGADWLDSLYDAVDYVTAAVYEYTDTVAFDILPDVPYSSDNARAGAQAGNEVAEAQAKAEMVIGITATGLGTGMMAGSGAAGATTCLATAGGGCVAGATGVAAGAAVTAAGIVTTGHGAMTLSTAQKKGEALNKSGGEIKGSNSKSRIINPPKAESSVWKGLENYKNGIKTNGLKGVEKKYYTWDKLHNDIEVFDNKGNHLGSMEPTKGEMYKPSKGHKLDL